MLVNKKIASKSRNLFLIKFSFFRYNLDTNCFKKKRMATKLVRLVNDKKKTVSTSGLNVQAGPGKRMRDVDTEEFIAELQSKCLELENQNKRLKENVTKFY
jgi:hypothetical protein